MGWTTSIGAIALVAAACAPSVADDSVATIATPVSSAVETDAPRGAYGFSFSPSTDDADGQPPFDTMGLFDAGANPGSPGWRAWNAHWAD